jgi:hypothetical protein
MSCRTVLAIALETAAEEARDLGGCSRRERGPRNVLAKHGGECVRDRLTLKQSRACQHLEEHDAKRPDIGAFVGLSPPCLFGAHVRRGSEDDTGGRGLCSQGWRIHRRRRFRIAGRECLRKTEIEHLHRTVVADLDVRGL